LGQVIGDTGEGHELHAVDGFDFQRLHEAFSFRVIIWISPPAHRAFEAVVGQFLAIAFRSV
jgi:hypothetical protein